MKPDHDEHWPLVPPGQDLSEDEEAQLLNTIRKRAQAIHDDLAAAGRYQSPEDDWLEAEKEVTQGGGRRPKLD